MKRLILLAALLPSLASAQEAPNDLTMNVFTSAQRQALVQLLGAAIVAQPNMSGNAAAFINAINSAPPYVLPKPEEKEK